MSAETVFSVCSILVLPGWLLLLFLPRWRWTLAVISAGVVPFCLGLVYLSLVVSQASAWPEGGGFGSVQEVAVLFKNPYMLTAGWIHYLAFDLFVGCWEMQDSHKHQIPHAVVVPCLLFTFLLGPVGLVGYLLVRWVAARQWKVFEGS